MNISGKIEKDAIVFDSRDWVENKRDAWIYGIVVGWDDDSLNELAQKFRWDKDCW